ncbi:MAG: hypothetical protein JXJ04_16515 [Spirochaetales bacterium]|nr:hypothetical protein [Spirochaetales bacterium]
MSGIVSSGPGGPFLQYHLFGPRIKLTGCDSDHPVEDVVFENLRIRDKVVTAPIPGVFRMAYAYNIQLFESAPESGKDLTITNIRVLDHDSVFSGSRKPDISQTFLCFTEYIETDRRYDYVELDISPALKYIVEGSYTISAWYKPLSLPVTDGKVRFPSHGIMMKQGYHIGLSYSADKAFILNQYVEGGVAASVGSYNRDNREYLPGKFYHITDVVNQPAGITKIYVNEKLRGQCNFTPSQKVQPLGNTP